MSAFDIIYEIDSFANFRPNSNSTTNSSYKSCTDFPTMSFDSLCDDNKIKSQESCNHMSKNLQNKLPSRRSDKSKFDETPSCNDFQIASKSHKKEKNASKLPNYFNDSCEITKSDSERACILLKMSNDMIESDTVKNAYKMLNKLESSGGGDSYTYEEKRKEVKKISDKRRTSEKSDSERNKSEESANEFNTYHFEDWMKGTPSTKEIFDYPSQYSFQRTNINNQSMIDLSDDRLRKSSEISYDSILHRDISRAFEKFGSKKQRKKEYNSNMSDALLMNINPLDEMCTLKKISRQKIQNTNGHDTNEKLSIKLSRKIRNLKSSSIDDGCNEGIFERVKVKNPVIELKHDIASDNDGKFDSEMTINEQPVDEILDAPVMFQSKREKIALKPLKNERISPEYINTNKINPKENEKCENVSENQTLMSTNSHASLSSTETIKWNKEVLSEQMILDYFVKPYEDFIDDTQIMNEINISKSDSHMIDEMTKFSNGLKKVPRLVCSNSHETSQMDNILDKSLSYDSEAYLMSSDALTETNSPKYSDQLPKSSLSCLSEISNINTLYNNSNDEMSSEIFTKITDPRKVDAISVFTDDENFENITEEVSPSSTTTRISRISLTSSEHAKKQKEAYENWKRSVEAREKKRKTEIRRRMQEQLEEAQIKKSLSEAKVLEWNRKKDKEAQEKIDKLRKTKQHWLEEKNKLKNIKKVFKREITHEEWLARKNEEARAKQMELKKREEEESRKREIEKFNKEQINKEAFIKWIEKTRKTPKPVPIGEGMESLKGSTTKLYINPRPWHTVIKSN